MAKTLKSTTIKEELRQVQQEVDRWPSWMKTNEIKETMRQSIGKDSATQKLSK